MPFSVNSIIKKAHNSEFVDAQKARQIAVLANSNPRVLFELHNNKAYEIEDKHEIIDNILAQSSVSMSTLTHIVPASVRNSMGDKTSLAALAAAGTYAYKKGTKTSATTWGAIGTDVVEDIKSIPGQPAAAWSSFSSWWDTKTDENSWYNNIVTPITNAGGSVVNAVKREFGQGADGETSVIADTVRGYGSNVLKNPFADDNFADKEQVKGGPAPTPGEKSWSLSDQGKKTLGYQAGTMMVVGLLYICTKRSIAKESKIGKIVSSDSAHVSDPVRETHLTNGGRYNGCLKDDSTLHKIFKKHDKEQGTIEELRFTLLGKWKSSLFGRNTLVVKHLVRNDGSLRDTAEEIANAINYNYSVFSYLSRGAKSLKNLVVGRRSSSQSYLKQRATKRSHSGSRSSQSSKNRSSKSSKRSAKGHSSRSHKR